MPQPRALNGACRCGAVRYVLGTDETPVVYCCHCLDCQTSSGSAFSEQMPVAEKAIDATGPVVDYSFTARAGATARWYRCDNCHTRLWNTNSSRPGLALLRAGTLDESHMLQPRFHVWASRKQPWIMLPDDMPTFAESPAWDEWMALLTV